ncbi:ATP-binding protein [Actinomadura litoris]|uniref:ATP-binding protein n=1 Tax=Actinomadura litoris TaxID=2678616 RepID=A0A7K1L7Z6_9ACTN|nr:ATP-binding protein [Actinomadura litoris]MUN40539.1 ATP-binding protein [Actinomadura litoris]
MTARLSGRRVAAQASSLPAVRHKVASTPSVLPDVRCLVRAAAVGYGIEGETAEDAVLVASELVTNAIRASAWPIALRMFVSKDGFHIEVHDFSRKKPRKSEPDLTMPSEPVPDDAPDPHGWGMGIVETLSRRHGVRIERGGKTVWAVLRIASGRRP